MRTMLPNNVLNNNTELLSSMALSATDAGLGDSQRVCDVATSALEASTSDALLNDWEFAECNEGFNSANDDKMRQQAGKVEYVISTAASAVASAANSYGLGAYAMEQGIYGYLAAQVAAPTTPLTYAVSCLPGGLQHLAFTQAASYATAYKVAIPFIGALPVGGIATATTAALAGAIVAKGAGMVYNTTVEHDQQKVSSPGFFASVRNYFSLPQSE